MSRDAAVAPANRTLPFTDPWPLLVSSLGAAILVMLMHEFAPHLTGARVVLIVAAVLAALGAVGVRLRTAREDAEDRFTAAGIVALASVVPFVCLLSLDSDWDSAGILLGVLVGVGLASALLLLLPRIVRRLTLTILVLIHFGGILSAVGSPAPPGGQPSWLINQLWVGVYRPYLHFMYLNNAYHFYSPDPGPPMLIWFRIEYEGGKSRWVEVPTLGDVRSKLAFQRRLALGESVNQLKIQHPIDFNDRLQKRIEAGRSFRRGAIPLLDAPIVTRDFEYREPIPYSKLLLKSYARYVVKHYPCADDPSLKPLKVKIYRVIHAILDQSQVADGFYPWDPTTYLPYYQGEFDVEGRLLDGPTFKDGQIDKPGNPFLYWLIPIKHELHEGYVQRTGPDGRLIPPGPKDFKLMDYLKIHAGDTESFWERQQKEAGR